MSRAFTGQRSTVFFTSWASKSPHSHQEGGREEHDDYQRGEIGEIACHSERQFDGVVGAPVGDRSALGSVQACADLNAGDGVAHWLTNTCG